MSELTKQNKAAAKTVARGGMGGMTKYMLKKVGWYLITLIVAFALNFFLPRMIPGNPVSILMSQMASGSLDTEVYQAMYEEFYAQFGLDQPLWQQFFTYIANIFKGDLGRSFTQYPRPVTEILASAIPWTVGLQLPAILCGWILGNLLGAMAAYKRGVYDKIIFPVTLFLSSIPMFIFSLILLYFFAVSLKWFPIGQGYSTSLLPSLSWTFIWDIIRHHQLPFLSLVLVMIGGQAIGMRSMSLYELNADYVLYAKLMGLHDKKVVKYVFRNAVLPQVTGLALSLGTMISGALITEIVFSYPGIGTTMMKAIRNVDYTLISGCTLVISITVLLANFLIEILYGFIDPRVRSTHDEEG